MFKVKAVLSQNSDPDCMYVSWVEYQPFMKLNMEYHLFDIIARVKSLHIKNLVLDPSSRQFIPSDENFKAFYELFLSALSDTELEKFARISIHNPAIESRFQQYLKEIKENLKVKFELRNFTDLEEAKKWLGISKQQPERVTGKQ